MIDLFRSESPGLQLHCGVAVTGAGAGSCKNPSCGKRSPALLAGYCMECATARGVNPLKACGCSPIRLTAAAMSETLLVSGNSGS